MDELEQRLARLRDINPEPTTTGAQIRQVSGLRWRRQIVGVTIAAAVAIGGGAWGAVSMMNHGQPAPTISATPLTPTLPPPPSTPPPVSVTTAEASASPTQPTATQTRTLVTPSARPTPTATRASSPERATPDPTATPTRSASTAPSMGSASPSVAASTPGASACLEAEKKHFCLKPEGWKITPAPDNDINPMGWSEFYTYSSPTSTVSFSTVMAVGGDGSECVKTDTHHVVRAAATGVADARGNTVYVATVVSHEGGSWVTRTMLVNKALTAGETFDDCQTWLLEITGVTGRDSSSVQGEVVDNRTFTSEDAAMKAANSARHTDGFDLLASLHSQ